MIIVSPEEISEIISLHAKAPNEKELALTTKIYLSSLFLESFHDSEFFKTTLFDLYNEGIEKQNALYFKRAGDKSLIETACFRQLIHGKGLSLDYYFSMGENSYSRVLEMTRDTTYFELSRSLRRVSRALHYAYKEIIRR